MYMYVNYMYICICMWVVLEVLYIIVCVCVDTRVYMRRPPAHPTILQYQTPQHQTNKQKQIVKLLLEYGADVGARAKGGAFNIHCLCACLWFLHYGR